MTLYGHDGKPQQFDVTEDDLRNTPRGGGAAEDGRDDGLIDKHAYELVRVFTDPATGEKFVQLRNPWGQNTEGETPEYIGPQDDQGLVTVPWDDIYGAGKNYVAIGKIPVPVAPTPKSRQNAWPL